MHRCVSVMTVVAVVFAFAAGGLPANVEEEPDMSGPLKKLVHNSNLVIDADVTEVSPYASMDEAGIVNYWMMVHCRKAIIGNAPHSDFQVEMARYVMGVAKVPSALIKE